MKFTPIYNAFRRSANPLMRGLALILAVIVFCLATAVVPAAAQVTARDATVAFLKETTFLASAARTASTATLTPIDLGAYDAGDIIINVTAVTGTSPTLLVNFQVCIDGTTTACVTHTSSASITATGVYLVKVNQFPRFCTISTTMGGTTPSFTFSVYGAFKPST